ncbi:MAG: GntR family transcriptional regulator [Sphingobium sp.]
MIDRHAAVPLYHQIYLQFRDEIVSGQRPYGSVLPTENAISSMFSVSRITSRRALDELAHHHLVKRRRHSGTHVTFKTPVQTIEANIDQAVEALIALGKGTSVSVAELKVTPPSAAVAKMLRLSPDEEVLRTVRIRHLGGQPLGHVVNYIPTSLCDHIQLTKLTDIPMLQLLEEAGHKAARAEQTIGAQLADPHLAQNLEVELQSAIICISRTVYDREDKPFLATFAHYRADKFVIGIDFEGAVLPAT